MVDALTDFLSQMHLLVLEESPLYQVPQGSTDLCPAGRVTHGPWPAATCAAVLRIWYSTGLIDLYRLTPLMAPAESPDEQRSDHVEHSAVTRVDALALLDHPDRWSLDYAPARAYLYQTDVGEATPWQRWQELVLDTARRLQLVLT